MDPAQRLSTRSSTTSRLGRSSRFLRFRNNVTVADAENYVAAEELVDIFVNYEN